MLRLGPPVFLVLLACAPFGPPALRAQAPAAPQRAWTFVIHAAIDNGAADGGQNRYAH